MKKLLPRKRLAMVFSILGIALMGVDLMITRNFFSHVGELMVLSLFCLVLGIVLNREPRETAPRKSAGRRDQARTY